MKKILSLFISLVFLFTLTACNNSKESTGDQNSDGGLEQGTVAPKYNLSYGEEFTFWGVTDEVSKPEIPALTWEEKDVNGIIQHKTNTPINFDKVSIEQQLKKNVFVRKMFQNIFNYESENHLGVNDSKLGYFTTFKTYNTVVGNNPDNHTSFSFSAIKENDRHNNWYTIETNIYNLPKDSFTQDDVYGMLKCVFGDYADFIVYGKDADNSSSYNGDASEKYALLEAEMVDFVGTVGNSYRLHRTVNSGEYKDTVTLKFGLRVYENEHADRYDYFFEDRSEIYEENAYTPNALLSKSFGVTNPSDGEEFGIALLNRHLPAFVTGKIEYWNVSEKTEEDGSVNYQFSIKDRYYDKKDNLQGDVFYNIDVVKKNGEVQKLLFNFNLHWDEEGMDADSQEYIDKSIAIMEEIFEIEIAPMKHNGNFRNTQNVKICIDGIDYDAVFDVNHNAVSTGIDINYKK